MPVPTQAQLNTLTLSPQRSELYLFVQRGDWLWTGQVSNVVSVDGRAQRLTVNTVSGYRQHVYAGMTAWVGTATNPRAKGRVRVIVGQDGGSAYIRVAPNSLNISLQDYIYVDRVLRLWTKADYNDADNPPLPNYYPPFACAGPNKAAWVGDYVRFWGSDSWTREGRTIVSAQWAFEGNPTIAGSTTGVNSPDAPLQVRWDTPGDYLVYFSVTDSTGQAMDTVRIVMVRNKPWTGATTWLPYTVAEIGQLSGSYSDGGWRGEVTTYGAADSVRFPDGAAVALVGRHWYGTSEINPAFGGMPSNEWIMFSGNLIGSSSASEGDAQRTTQFTIGTLHEYASATLSAAGSFVPTQGYNGWYNKASGWKAVDVLYHQCVFNSTLGHITDVLPNMTDLNRRVDYFDIDETDLLTQVSEDVGSTCGGKLCFDRFGRAFVQRDANTRTQSERAAFGSPTFLFDNTWWTAFDLGEEAHWEETAQINYVGAYINPAQGPSKGNLQSIIVDYPAEPGSFGSVEQITGEMVSGIGEATERAKAYWARANSRFKKVTIKLANVGGWEPAQQEYVAVNLSAGDTNRGWVFSSKEFIVRESEMTFSDGVCRWSVSLEDSIWGSQGVMGTYPQDRLLFGATPPTAVVPLDQRTGRDVVACWNYGIHYCTDILAAQPVWEDRTSNLVGKLARYNQGNLMVRGVLRCPDNVATHWLAWGHFGIAETFDAGRSWTVVYNVNTFAYFNPNISNLAHWCVLKVVPAGYQPGMGFVYVALVVYKGTAPNYESQSMTVCTNYTLGKWPGADILNHTYVGQLRNVQSTNPSSPRYIADLVASDVSPGVNQSPIVYVCLSRLGSNFGSDANKTGLFLCENIITTPNTAFANYYRVLTLGTGGTGLPGNATYMHLVKYNSPAADQVYLWAGSPGSQGGRSIYYGYNLRSNAAYQTSVVDSGGPYPMLNYGGGLIPHADGTVNEARLWKTIGMDSLGYGHISYTTLGINGAWTAMPNGNVPRYGTGYLASAAGYWPNENYYYLSTDNFDSNGNGLVYITRDKLVTWQDKTGNLKNIQTVGPANDFFGSGPVWDIQPNTNY